MRKLLNTLYVHTQGIYLHLEGETVVIEHEGKKVQQLPLHNLQGIVCFGNVLCSPFLLGHCAEKGISISFLTEYGRFLARVQGNTNGNVLTRRKQYRAADDGLRSRDIAVNMLRGKLANSRYCLLRAFRDHAPSKEDTSSKKENDSNAAQWNEVQNAARSIGTIIERLGVAADLDTARGLEGLAAAEYFRVFDTLIIDQKEFFSFNTRIRRPPRDAVNAMLSFVYTLVRHDCRAALETVGLDPAVGFLHRDRPGRPGLALDLMEEFRSPLADRLVLTLINRGQVHKKDFTTTAVGAVQMDDATRRTLVTAYQERKQKKIWHPFIKENIEIGLLFFVQANLLRRHIAGDYDGYPPFIWH